MSLKLWMGEGGAQLAPSLSSPAFPCPPLPSPLPQRPREIPVLIGLIKYFFFAHVLDGFSGESGCYVTHSSIKCFLYDSFFSLTLTRSQSSSTLYRAHEAGRNGYRQRERKVPMGRDVKTVVMLCCYRLDELRILSQCFLTYLMVEESRRKAK